MHTPDFGTTPDRSLPSFELSSSTVLNNLGNINLVFPVKTRKIHQPYDMGMEAHEDIQGTDSPRPTATVSTETALIVNSSSF
jgi:hypothetical protein